MYRYEAVEIYVYTFHSSGLDSGDPSVSRSSCFYFQETFGMAVTWKNPRPGWRVYNKRRRNSHPSFSLETIPTELPRPLYYILLSIIELLVLTTKLAVF